jgi:hypothetical protein
MPQKQMPEKQITILQKIEIGLLLGILSAIIGFAFWLGGVQTKVDRIDPQQVDLKLAEAISKSSIPKGTVLAWYAPTGPVPIGWAICDGSNAPDLRGHFLRGSDQFKNVGQRGGREKHSHTVWRHINTKGNGVADSSDRELGNTEEQEHLPPYVDVIFIMKL